MLQVADHDNTLKKVPLVSVLQVTDHDNTLKKVPLVCVTGDRP